MKLNRIKAVLEEKGERNKPNLAFQENGQEF